MENEPAVPACEHRIRHAEVRMLKGSVVPPCVVPEKRRSSRQSPNIGFCDVVIVMISVLVVVV